MDVGLGGDPVFLLVDERELEIRALVLEHVHGPPAGLVGLQVVRTGFRVLRNPHKGFRYGSVVVDVLWRRDLDIDAEVVGLAHELDQTEGAEDRILQRCLRSCLVLVDDFLHQAPGEPGLGEHQDIVLQLYLCLGTPVAAVAAGGEECAEKGQHQAR